MSLLQNSGQIRESMLRTNLYTPNRPYNLDNTNIDFIQQILNNFTNTSNIAINLISTTILPDNGTENSKLLQIAYEKIKSDFADRIKNETRASFVPNIINNPVSSLSRALRGDTEALFLTQDSYDITRATTTFGNVTNFIERITGINFINRQADDVTVRLVLTDNLSQEFIDATGTKQYKKLTDNVSNTLSFHASFTDYVNFNTKLTSKNKFFNYKNKVYYYLDGIRNEESQNKFNNYIFSRQTAESLRTDTLEITKTHGKFTTSENESILNTAENGSLTRNLFLLGEFGEFSYDLKDKGYDCETTKEETDTIDTNRLETFITPDEENYFYFGNPNTEDILKSANAKRGLLYYLGNLSKSLEDSKQENPLNSNKTCYKDVNGNIVFKATPCRSWTYKDQKLYGNKITDLVRYKGNNKDYSVLKDFVIPKIYPLRKNYESFNQSEPNEEQLMFSIENLAWTKQDLINYQIPRCEWGNNYGRKMWFQPTIKNYSESVDPRFNQNQIIGRTEPIYTYANTKTSASLSFVIYVDHPNWINKENNFQDIIYKKMVGCEPLTDEDLAEDFSINPTTTSGTTSDSSITVLEEVPISDSDILKPSGTYYFPNDIYSVPSEVDGVTYEDRINTDIAVVGVKKNLINYSFGLNIPFLFNKDFSINQNQLNSITDKGVISEIKTSLTNNKISKYYTVNVSGFASNFYEIGELLLKYNIYLSARRAFSMVKYLFDNGSLQNSNNYRVSQTNTTLDSYLNNIDNIVVANESQYNFTTNTQLTFVAANQPTIIVSIKGIDNAVASDNTVASINNLDTKRQRKVDVSLTFDNEAYNGDKNANNITNSVTNRDTGQADGTVSAENVQVSNNEILNCFKYSNSEAWYNNNVSDNINLRINYSRKSEYVPTYHTLTPEDLHRRVTFLKQCAYPSEVKLDYGASNSAFGRPPICILRIGDQVHTKIIINNIRFNYSDSLFDLNQEGMGVQYMMVNVDLNFEILGGQSLKTHIDKLPSSFYFNFGANSTFYDTGIYSFAKQNEDKQTEIKNANIN